MEIAGGQGGKPEMSPGSGLDKGRGVGAGDLFLLGAVFAWGINFPLAKIALDYMDPFVFSATRYLGLESLCSGLDIADIRGVDFGYARQQTRMERLAWHSTGFCRCRTRD